MTEQGQKELQDLLKEGISALREMRRGFENACADLRTFYGKTSNRITQRTSGVEEDGRRKQGRQKSYIAYN